jgi:hypothetical protein
VKCQEFAAGYDVEHVLAPRGEQFNELMADSRYWAHYLGRITHGILSNQNVTESEGFSVDKWRSYLHWIAKDGNETIHRAMAIQPPEDARRALNEFNFHELTYSMIDMWRPVLSRNPWQNNEARKLSINNARDGLAVAGVSYALKRKQLIEKLGGTEPIFEKPDSDEALLYSGIVGKMQEYDAAIVLLDVMRRNADLTVIPAPMQFSIGTHQPRNSNFLAIDTKRETVVGVQVASRLTSSKTKDADTDRVVFVDGDADFDNVKAVRVKSRTSKEKIVPWPGIIAAKSLERMKPYGKGRNVAAARDPRVTKYKFFAREVVGNVEVDFSELSTLIGNRILAKLVEE